MGYNKRYKRLSELTIAELAGNRCLEEILDFRDLLKQSIRLYMSRFLYNTDLDDPFECNIPLTLTETCQKSRTGIIITHIWQDPIEGINSIKNTWSSHRLGRFGNRRSNKLIGMFNPTLIVILRILFYYAFVRNEVTIYRKSGKALLNK